MKKKVSKETTVDFFKEPLFGIARLLALLTVLTLEHIHLLFFWTENTSQNGLAYGRKKVKEYVRQGYLEFRQRPGNKRGKKEYCYSLTKQSFKLLSQALDEKIVYRQVPDALINHNIEVSWLYIALRMQYEGQDIPFQWLGANDGRLHVTGQGSVKLAIEPDATILVNNRRVFLELDTGKVSIENEKEKMLKYVRYLAENSLLFSPNEIIFYATSSPKRARELSDAWREVAGDIGIRFIVAVGSDAEVELTILVRDIIADPVDVAIAEEGENNSKRYLIEPIELLKEKIERSLDKKQCILYEKPRFSALGITHAEKMEPDYGIEVLGLSVYYAVYEYKNESKFMIPCRFGESSMATQIIVIMPDKNINKAINFLGKVGLRVSNVNNKVYFTTKQLIRDPNLSIQDTLLSLDEANLSWKTAKGI